MLSGHAIFYCVVIILYRLSIILKDFLLVFLSFRSVEGFPRVLHVFYGLIYLSLWIIDEIYLHCNCGLKLSISIIFLYFSNTNNIFHARVAKATPKEAPPSPCEYFSNSLLESLFFFFPPFFSSLQPLLKIPSSSYFQHFYLDILGDLDLPWYFNILFFPFLPLFFGLRKMTKSLLGRFISLPPQLLWK